MARIVDPTGRYEDDDDAPGVPSTLEPINFQPNVIRPKPSDTRECHDDPALSRIEFEWTHYLA